MGFPGTAWEPEIPILFGRLTDVAEATRDKLVPNSFALVYLLNDGARF